QSTTSLDSPFPFQRTTSSSASARSTRTATRVRHLIRLPEDNSRLLRRFRYFFEWLDRRERSVDILDVNVARRFVARPGQTEEAFPVARKCGNGERQLEAVLFAFALAPIKSDA